MTFASVPIDFDLHSGHSVGRITRSSTGVRRPGDSGAVRNSSPRLDATDDLVDRPFRNVHPDEGGHQQDPSADQQNEQEVCCWHSTLGMALVRADRPGSGLRKAVAAVYTPASLSSKENGKRRSRFRRVRDRQREADAKVNLPSDTSRRTLVAHPVLRPEPSPPERGG